MLLLEKNINKEELQEIAKNIFGNVVKLVVDVENEIIALDAELHIDLAELLVKNGSTQKNLWGVNIYPDVEGDDWLEFDSMVNLKPQFGNRSRFVENPIIREKIIKIIKSKINL
ncbi:MAG: DUF5674 family protein [Patescibacteria group bacterium]